MAFKITDRVRVKRYEDLPEEVKRKGLARHAGEDGEIVDIMWSNAKNCYVYRIQFDGCDSPSKTDYVEGTFDHIPNAENATYHYEFEFAENLVIARLYETNGDLRRMIARGHGHIFHEGALGIAQASSYALKRIYHTLEGSNNVQESD